MNLTRSLAAALRGTRRPAVDAASAGSAEPWHLLEALDAARDRAVTEPLNPVERAALNALCTSERLSLVDIARSIPPRILDDGGLLRPVRRLVVDGFATARHEMIYRTADDIVAQATGALRSEPTPGSTRRYYRVTMAGRAAAASAGRR